MVQSYKKKPLLKKSYDTIIIGSGMGGLATAAILAKKGQKVLILEKHYTPGGFTHVFKRKGFEWDVGIHYIGEMQRETSILKKLFDYITDGKLKWADMGEVYDRIVIGDTHYDFKKGVGNFKKQMIAYFPDEEKAIHSYVDLIFKAVKTSKNYYISKAVSPLWTFLFGKILKQPFYKFSDQTTYEVLRKLTTNETLIKVLTAQYGDYGLPPKQSSFAMHASVAKHYMQGGSVPAKGSSQILKTIEKVIKKSGGTILVRADVDKIIVDNNKAKGVRMTDGNHFYADTIISGTGVFNTFENLLPSDVIYRHKLNEKLKSTA